MKLAILEQIVLKTYSQVNAELTKYAQTLVAPQRAGGLGYTHLSSELSSFKPEETRKYFENIYQ